MTKINCSSCGDKCLEHIDPKERKSSVASFASVEGSYVNKAFDAGAANSKSPDDHVQGQDDQSENETTIPISDEKTKPPIKPRRRKSSVMFENGNDAELRTETGRIQFNKLMMEQLRRRSVDLIKFALKGTVDSCKGIVLAGLSAFFFTLTAVIVKQLDNVSASYTAMFRFVGILLLTLPMLIDGDHNALGPANKRFYLIGRGVAGATSLYFRYSALKLLPISNATIITLSSPVFVCLFARLFLGEPCGLFHVIALTLTLLGIGFTSSIGSFIGLGGTAPDVESELLGLLFSLIATLIGSLTYIFVRKLKEVHHSVILINFSTIAIIETALIGLAIDGNDFSLPSKSAYDVWLLVALAILSFYAQLLLTRSLQIEEAALVSVTRSSSEVLFAFLFQIVIFGQMPHWNTYIGASLVTLSVILTAFRKWLAGKAEDHYLRKHFWFALK